MFHNLVLIWRFAGILALHEIHYYIQSTKTQITMLKMDTNPVCYTNILYFPNSSSWAHLACWDLKTLKSSIKGSIQYSLSLKKSMDF